MLRASRMPIRIRLPTAPAQFHAQAKQRGNGLRI
jgi:hypothetical protein